MFDPSLLLQPNTYILLQVPYKYDMTKFVNVGSISVDHIDPSIFCVLTAKSRDLTSPLADFLIFSPRWDVASRMSASIQILLKRRVN